MPLVSSRTTAPNCCRLARCVRGSRESCLPRLTTQFGPRCLPWSKRGGNGTPLMAQQLSKTSQARRSLQHRRARRPGRSDIPRPGFWQLHSKRARLLPIADRPTLFTGMMFSNSRRCRVRRMRLRHSQIRGAPTRSLGSGCLRPALRLRTTTSKLTRKPAAIRDAWSWNCGGIESLESRLANR